MPDGGPPLPPQPPVKAVVPPWQPADAQQPVYPTTASDTPVQPVVPPVQSGPLSLFSWSQFKPGFAGKPDEDAESMF